MIMFTYNIHPILVHFPIALLFIYSVIKILPFKKWMPSVAWRHIERALLLLGVFGAFAALATGDLAEHLSHPNRALVEMHSTFATIATWIYGALLLGETASVIRSDFGVKIRSSMLLKKIAFIERILCDRIFSKILALAGFIAITVTGLLGGVMVYGTSADPLAGFVLKILGLQL